MPSLYDMLRATIVCVTVTKLDVTNTHCSAVADAYYYVFRDKLQQRPGLHYYVIIVWPLLKTGTVDCSGVARSFEPEGHKGPRHFLVGDMGARGGKENLPPPPEYKNMCWFQWRTQDFWSRGAHVTQVFSCGGHACQRGVGNKGHLPPSQKYKNSC